MNITRFATPDLYGFGIYPAVKISRGDLMYSLKDCKILKRSLKSNSQFF